MARPRGLRQWIPTLFLLTGCSTAMSAPQTKFDWLASESAPEHFPMQIIHGSLGYHGEPGSLYVPSGVIISHGWGRMRSVHVTGPDLKPLPDRLDISFFSYLEDQFYEGSFELPYEKILKQFQDWEAAPKRKNRDGKESPNAYHIIVGVAPGGTVAVWVTGLGATEVLFGKAKKVEMDFQKAINYPSEKRAEFVRKVIEHRVSPDLLASFRRNGIPFDKWANYRIRYSWGLTLQSRQPPTNFGMGFFNGEGRSFNYPLEPAFTASRWPVPDNIDFRTVANDGTSYYYNLYFDEAETIGAFAKLAARQLPLQLEIEPRAPKTDTRIRLTNGQESIELKKFTVK